MKSESWSRGTAVFEELPCAFCKGVGRGHVAVAASLAACSVCGGRGKVLSLAPAEACDHCTASGGARSYGPGGKAVSISCMKSLVMMSRLRQWPV